jgi:hypothetical protein
LSHSVAHNKLPACPNIRGKLQDCPAFGSNVEDGVRSRMFTDMNRQGLGN